MVFNSNAENADYSNKWVDDYEGKLRFMVISADFESQNIGELSSKYGRSVVGVSKQGPS